MARQDDLAAAVTAAAVRLHTTSTVEESLDTMGSLARDTLAEIDHVGVTLLDRRGRLETAAATDDLVVDLDRLQYTVGEGPSLTALRSESETVTYVANARHETRWRAFIPPAVRRGLRPQLGVRLLADDRTVGVLNCYSVSSDTISAETHHLAELFATHAALAYGRTRKITDLQEALATRQLVGQATGLIMGRYGVDSRRAFDYLVRVSSTEQVKLRDLARDLVNQADGAPSTDHGRHPPEPAPSPPSASPTTASPTTPSPTTPSPTTPSPTRESTDA